jgi:hypothetical protein
MRVESPERTRAAETLEAELPRRWCASELCYPPRRRAPVGRFPRAWESFKQEGARASGNSPGFGALGSWRLRKIDPFDNVRNPRVLAKRSRQGAPRAGTLLASKSVPFAAARARSNLPDLDVPGSYGDLTFRVRRHDCSYDNDGPSRLVSFSRRPAPWADPFSRSNLYRWEGLL